MATRPTSAWRRRRRAGVGFLLCAAVVAGASAASASGGLTATGIRIGGHPAFVRAVVDFTGGRLNDNEVTLTRLTGTAATLRVSRRNVHTRAAPRSGSGIGASIQQGSNRLRVQLTFAKNRIKYVLFSVVTHDRLAIDLWKSAPPSRAAEVRSGRNRCLTLDRWSVRPGVLSVAGSEHNIFEHTFEVLVRGADGRVLGRHPGVHGVGHWTTKVHYRAARRQAGTLEAVDFGGRGEGPACLAQVRVTLPAHP